MDKNVWFKVTRLSQQSVKIYEYAQRETDESTITARDFNTPLSEIGRSRRQKSVSSSLYSSPPSLNCI